MTFALLFLIMIANIIDTFHGKPVIESASMTSIQRLTKIPITWHKDNISMTWHMPEIPITRNGPEIDKNRTVVLREAGPRITYSESTFGNDTNFGFDVNVDGWDFSVPDFVYTIIAGVKTVIDTMTRLFQLRIQSVEYSGGVTNITLYK
ncbi:uncharacterized protein LOC135841147 [Planococcus citri]|uniref:uncharacterized protein LOC135841147 n=1 Tax=Planococcus citri TaxID=170843 RepID=UPI0031F7ACAF